MLRNSLHTQLVFVLLLLFFCPAATFAGDNEERARRLKEVLDGEPLLERMQLGLLVYDLTENTEVYGYGAKQVLRPASCQKILTAVTALDRLGTDYVLQTTLSVTGHMEGNLLVGDIIVRGACDPLIGKTDLQGVVNVLAQRGIRSIAGSLIVDKTMKDTLQWGWGWCWDDDNPTLSPLLYEREDNFAEALYKLLRQRGISFERGEQALPSEAQSPLSTDILYQINISHSIGDVLRPMMKESDNLYAESLFYCLAASTGRPNASRRSGAEIIKNEMQRAGCYADYYDVADGSGLSLYNYASADVLVAFLRYAYARPAIYNVLFASLPVAGRDGTLKNRMKETKAAGRIHAKTGTVTGISALSGYAQSPDGHTLAFAIICQGVVTGREARALQDRICQALM